MPCEVINNNYAVRYSVLLIILKGGRDGVPKSIQPIKGSGMTTKV